MTTTKMTQEQKFMQGFLDEFSSFVIRSMAVGVHTKYDDHHEFMKASLEVFLAMINAGPGSGLKITSDGSVLRVQVENYDILIACVRPKEIDL